MNIVVARWKTKGKDFLELHQSQLGFSYVGNGCGGWLTSVTKELATQEMEVGPVKVLRSDRPSLKREF
jgi:hypothetical protein